MERPEGLARSRLLLVGCGNMAGAMLAGWLDAGLDPSGVTVVRPSGHPPRADIATVRTIAEAGGADIVLLGVKPQMLGEVAPGLAGRVTARTTLVSILAGVELATLRQRFADAGPIVRAMPNLPVALRQGVVPMVGEAGRSGEVDALMRMLGAAEWFDDERLFALAGHLTGAGPAFVFRFIDALAGAAAGLGLGETQSLRLATAMVAGAATLAQREEVDPATLARRVASPGGTTQAGLDVLDGDDALRRLLAATLAASKRRGEELAATARGPDRA